MPYGIYNADWVNSPSRVGRGSGMARRSYAPTAQPFIAPHYINYLAQPYLTREPETTQQIIEPPPYVQPLASKTTPAANPAAPLPPQPAPEVVIPPTNPTTPTNPYSILENYFAAGAPQTTGLPFEKYYPINAGVTTDQVSKVLDKAKGDFKSQYGDSNYNQEDWIIFNLAQLLENGILQPATYT